MRIRLENLTKRYQEVTAVDHLNLEIEDGDLVCLLGPSGCGKSTTLSIIAGLEQATEGSIYFDEENVGGLEAEERDIGMVFQDYALYPHMTVQENIAFPKYMRDITNGMSGGKACMILYRYCSGKRGQKRMTFRGKEQPESQDRDYSDRPWKNRY